MMLPLYETKTFSQVFESYDDFKEYIDIENGLVKDLIKEDSKKTIYWLLYARFGNNPIVNLSENIFKAKLVSIIFQKGPTWERRLEIQNQIRNLSDDQLRTGAMTIMNSALNPETEPGTHDTEELNYVNQQNVNKHKRSALDAYEYLQDLLKTDVTEPFIESFSVLFSKFVRPDVEHIYISDEGEEL